VHNPTVIAHILGLQTALNYGQTPAQIDAMGLDGWIAFCEKKERKALPEYELRAQVYHYAGAVRATNKARISKLPKFLQTHTTALASELENYSTRLVEMEEAAMGGGTMYILFYASASAKSAETIKALTTNNFKAKAKFVVSDVTKALNSLDPLVKGADPDFSKPSNAAAALSAAKASFSKIAALMAKRPRPESDFVLEYCKSRTILNSGT